MTRRTPRNRPFVLACAFACSIAPCIGALSVLARPAQSDHRYHLPNVVSGGRSAAIALLSAGPHDRGGAIAPHGIVGFGESTIEMQSLTSRDTRVRIDLKSTGYFSDVVALARIGPGGALAMPLRHQEGVTYSNYAATVTGEGPLGALARTMWSSGAEAVYEAPMPATRSILPLAARDVYSHTSVIWMQNTHAETETEVHLELFGDTGALDGSWTYVLEPGGAGRIDLLYQTEFDALPTNAATGFLGAMHIDSDMPVVVTAYGDEPQGRGAAALRARPAASAENVQLLPFVRAGAAGHSLIAIANASGERVDVTIAYRGTRNSPAGAGRTVEQTLQIGPRSHAFVDLDTRLRRGNRPPPDLPRGGFVGSAVIRASGPVLAAVLDQTLGTTSDPSNGFSEVLVSMAYDGVGLGELSAVHGVPRARYQDNGATTELVLHNPGDAPVAVAIDLRALDTGALMGTDTVAVPPADAVAWSVRLPAPGVAHAVLRASAPIAVLAVDVSPAADWSAYRAVPLPDALIDVPTPAPPPTYTATATQAPPTPVPTGVGPTPTPGTVPPATYLPWAARRR